MKDVKVYGIGCKRCQTAEAMVRDAATKLGVAIAVEKVTDPRAIAQAGVMSTPGIAIDGKIVHAGGLPDAAVIEKWLTA